MSWKHEPAKINEVLPMEAQQVSQTVHFGVNNTDVTPIDLQTSTRTSAIDVNGIETIFHTFT